MSFLSFLWYTLRCGEIHIKKGCFVIFYLILCKLNTSNVHFFNIDNYIKKCSIDIHYYNLNNLWIIKSPLTSNEIYGVLKPLLDYSDCLIVSEIKNKINSYLFENTLLNFKK